MATTISQAAFAALSRAGTSAVANGIETFKARLRNEGYLDHSIACRTSPDYPMMGYAVTMEMRTDQPPTTGMAYTERNDWWETIAALPRPKVIVIADVGDLRGVGAVAGETHASIYKALGAVGIVTNGAIRDQRALAEMGMHVFSAGVSPSHGYAHIVGVGNPVEVGGLRIESGDLLHGDRDGIVKVPAAIAEDLPPAIARMRREEEKILELCRAPDFSVTALLSILTVLSDVSQG